MSAPRLKRQDHKISSFLIRITATPLAMFLSCVLVVGYLFWVGCFNPSFDELWQVPKLIFTISFASMLLSLLDLISNAYQEVSADIRQQELMQRLDQIECSITKQSHTVTLL